MSSFFEDYAGGSTQDIIGGLEARSSAQIVEIRGGKAPVPMSLGDSMRQILIELILRGENIKPRDAIYRSQTCKMLERELEELVRTHTSADIAAVNACLCKRGAKPLIHCLDIKFDGGMHFDVAQPHTVAAALETIASQLGKKTTITKFAHREKLAELLRGDAIPANDTSAEMIDTLVALEQFYVEIIREIQLLKQQ